MDNIAPYFHSILSKTIELFVGLSVVLISAWYLRYYHFYKHMKHIPSIPHVLPLFGTALQFPTTVAIHDNIKKYRHKLGGVFWTMMGLRPAIFVTDPNLIGMVLNTNIDKPWIYAYFHRWLGPQSLFTSRGQRWKSLRKIFTPAFHFKILEASVETFDSTSDVLVRKLNDEVGKESTDIYPFMSRATLDSVCEAAMGAKINAQDNEESTYVKSVNDLTGIIMGRSTSITEHFEFTYRFTKNYRREIEGIKIVHDYVNAIIVKRKQETLSSASDSSNHQNDFGEKRKLAFLDLLLQFNNNNTGVFLTDEDIRQGVDSFLFGGYDTEACTLSFAVYLLANNPDVQQKAFEELQSIFADDQNRRLTFKDVQDMKYLDLVLKETLRMFPAIPLYGRLLYEDMEYDGKILPKGLTIGIATYLMHMDEKYFPNPEKFEPERFSQENSKDRHPYCYVPFSAGPRICIGQKFGMIAMKATLSKILRNFELLPVEHDMVLALETVLKSTNGIMVKIKKRRW